MFLSDIGIMQLQDKEKLLEPFDENRLTGNGYDMTILDHCMVDPKETILVSTAEVVSMPNDLLAILHLRTTFMRQGLVALTGVVDAGYKGQLTIGLYNSNTTPVAINKGERFLHIIFARLSSPSTRPYRGKYQETRGVAKAKKD